ncbi:MAG: type II toxin-antitoxin system YafQ family toxin [Anaerolineae bacterium]|nr:type II toxin-antitoxin system YafQ family toxin [Anaerolineae bacterium]
MRKITVTAHFEKSVKLAKKRGYDLSKMSAVILLLGQGGLEDRQYHDHPLKGKYEGLRECHISPDWLLIYHTTESEVILMNSGTHADLFR